MSARAEKFVQLFSRLWDERDFARDPGKLGQLFHEEGGLTHPGQRRMSLDEIPAYFNRVFAVVPDLRVEVKNWASRGDVIYIEERITGTVGGQKLELPGVVRAVLRGGRAIDVMGHWDTFPVWTALDPSMKRGDLLAAAGA